MAGNNGHGMVGNGLLTVVSHGLSWPVIVGNVSLAILQSAVVAG